jgi:hypothetical protein
MPIDKAMKIDKTMNITAVLVDSFVGFRHSRLPPKRRQHGRKAELNG